MTPTNRIKGFKFGYLVGSILTALVASVILGALVGASIRVWTWAL